MRSRPLLPPPSFWPSAPSVSFPAGTVDILAADSPAERPRLLSEADCQDIGHRLARSAQGGGSTTAVIWSTWTGNVRWGRNRLTTTGEIRNDHIKVIRNIHGSGTPWVLINDWSDAALVAADRRNERLLPVGRPEMDMNADLLARYQTEPTTAASIFFESTYQLDAEHRAATAIALMQTAAQAGMLSAGYIEVGAHSMALIDTLGHTCYVPYTTARVSVTVRDPKGTGSGWAGVDWPDWSRVDGNTLMATAVEKCLRSRNPLAVEPGRYTTILEPQAVCDFVSQLMERGDYFDLTESGMRLPHLHGPFSDQPPTWKQKKGQQVMDPRITISADPTDPDLAFPPFNVMSGPDIEWWIPLFYRSYHPAVWIERGVVKDLAYDRDFAIDVYGENTGLPNSGAFRMSGGDTTVDEMIATTKRGLLMTRFSGVDLVDSRSVLCRGYTRDGLWLIENGKISKAVKNMVFTESPLFALNNVEQLGTPQRAFHPMETQTLRTIPQPVIVPPLKIRDFSFTAIAEAV